MEPWLEKKFKQMDLIILLGFLLIFSLSIGLLHGGGQSDNETPETIYAQTFTLIEAGDAAQLAKLLAAFPNHLFPVLDKVLQAEHSSFSRNNKVRLILKLAHRLPKKETQEQLFQVLVTKGNLLEGDPILYLAGRGKNTPQAIIPFLQWSENYLKTNPKLNPKLVKKLQSALSDALLFAIAQNDLATIKKIIEQKVTIAAPLATQLLQETVKRNASLELIDIFKKLGADVDAEYANQKGITPLIQAVKNQNEAMVEKIIKANANVNLIKDPGVGSALQHAVQLRNTDLDTLLRKYGARE